jgi:hypothetical protein
MREGNDLTPRVTRRFVLAAGVSAAAIAAGATRRAWAQGNVTVEQFRALSARLTERPVADLDPAMAGKLLDGILSAGGGPGLRLLLDNPQTSTGTAADDLVAGWYAGLLQGRAGPKVAGFTEALVWDALDFTKPFGSCGGATGYWADPP